MVWIRCLAVLRTTLVSSNNVSFFSKQFRLFVQRSDGATVHPKILSGRSLFIMSILALVLLSGFGFFIYVFFDSRYVKETQVEVAAQIPTKKIEELRHKTIRAERLKNKLERVTQLYDGRRQVQFELERVLVNSEINWFSPSSDELQFLAQKYYPHRFRSDALKDVATPHDVFQPDEAISSDDMNSPYHMFMPLGWPVMGYVESTFGEGDVDWEGDQDFHLGVDLIAPLKSPIFSTADGFVIVADTFETHGQMIMIQHILGYVTVYAHLGTMNVETGDKVKRGQTIGTLGNTGTTHKSHLHYEVRKNGLPVNPRDFMGEVVVLPKIPSSHTTEAAQGGFK